MPTGLIIRKKYEKVGKPRHTIKATNRDKLLCLGPQVVALIIFTRTFQLMEPILGY